MHSQFMATCIFTTDLSMISCRELWLEYLSAFFFLWKSTHWCPVENYSLAVFCLKDLDTA